MFPDHIVVDIKLKYHTTVHLENRHPDKWTMRRLAKRYNCSYQTIFKIIKGETYEWVVTEYD